MWDQLQKLAIISFQFLPKDLHLKFEVVACTEKMPQQAEF